MNPIERQALENAIKLLSDFVGLCLGIAAFILVVMLLLGLSGCGGGGDSPDVFVGPVACNAGVCK